MSLGKMLPLLLIFRLSTLNCTPTSALNFLYLGLTRYRLLLRYCSTWEREAAKLVCLWSTTLRKEEITREKICWWLVLRLLSLQWSERKDLKEITHLRISLECSFLLPTAQLNTKRQPKQWPMLQERAEKARGKVFGFWLTSHSS